MIRLMVSRHPDNMKTPVVPLLLGVCVLLLSALTISAVSLQVSPNLQMFFRRSSLVSLGCVDDDDGQTADGWKVKRIRGGPTEDCRSGGSDFVRVNSSFCALNLSVSSGGNFLCEDSSGWQSDKLSVKVSDEGMILEIPALPVRAGSNVTLRCRNRNGSAVVAYFHFNESHVGPKSELFITDVQQSNEDLYWCSTEEFESSPLGFLRIRELPPPPPPPRVSVLRLFCHLVVFCLYCISAGLLLSICCRRKTANNPAVLMETSHRGGGDQRLDEEHNVTVDVTTEYDF